MRSGRGGEDVVYPLGGREEGRLQGAGAPRCHTFPRHALDRQLEVSSLSPATNGEGFSSPPLLLFVALQRGKKGNFSRFENKQGQSTEREHGGSKGSSSRAFEPKN